MTAREGMHADVRDRVRRFVADLESAGLSEKVDAVVVSGSAARGEEVRRDGTLISDIDVMVVTRSESLALGRRIGKILAKHAPYGLEGGRVPLRALRTYRTLEYFEAQERGCTVFGDSRVLQHIGIDGAALPAWEAVRLLLNRTFEHIKVAVGTTSAQACVVKTYQALGEAQLTVEGRYRPSFAERVAEVERCPLESHVPRLQERYLRSYEARSRPAVQMIETPEDASADLQLLLGRCLPLVTGISGGIPSQFDALARQERHLKHRLFWAGITFPRWVVAPSGLGRDPILNVWEGALTFLRTGRGDPHLLLRDWHRCPQIYRTASTRS